MHHSFAMCQFICWHHTPFIVPLQYDNSEHSGDYEKLILFVKLFCVFFSKICKNKGHFPVSYTHIPYILQTISSIITGLFGSFAAHSAPVKVFSYLFWFLRKVFRPCKKHISAQEICWNRFTQNRNNLSLKINYTYPHKKRMRKGDLYEFWEY